jgi:hypothetical protein
MAFLAEKNSIALCKLYTEIQQAQAAIVVYLQRYRSFAGSHISEVADWIRDHDLAMTAEVYPMDPASLCDTTIGLMIGPPSHGDHYYRVVYETECYSRDGVDAAQAAWKAIRAKDAPDPALTLIDSQGTVTHVDLANVHAFNKITPGFVTQRYRKDDDGLYRCCWQEFTAGDEVQYERPDGERIDPPNYDYQEYNMILESEGGILLGLRRVLQALDVGGEPSRQYADQIKTLKSLIQTLTRV